MMKIYKILQVSTGKYFDQHNNWSNYNKARTYTKKNFAEISIKECLKEYKLNEGVNSFENLEDIRIVEEEYHLVLEKFYKPFEK